MPEFRPKNRWCGVNLTQDEMVPGAGYSVRCRRRSVMEFFIDFDDRNAAIPVCGVHYEVLEKSRRQAGPNTLKRLYAIVKVPLKDVGL